MKNRYLQRAVAFFSLLVFLSGCSTKPIDVPSAVSSEVSEVIGSESESEIVSEDTSDNSSESTVSTRVSSAKSSSAASKSQSSQKTSSQSRPVNTGPWKQEEFYLTTGLVGNILALDLAKDVGMNLIEFGMFGAEHFKEPPYDRCDALGLKSLIHGQADLSGTGSYLPGRSKSASVNESVIKEATELASRYSNVIGYYAWDEPDAESIPLLKKQNDLFKKYDPSSLVFYNLIPSYGPLAWDANNATDSAYLKYVDDHLKIVNPDVLSLDYYPFAIDPNTTGANNWYRDMGLFRAKSIEYKKPFWYYYQAVDLPSNQATNITEGQIKIGMYTGLVYGAKSLSSWTAVGFMWDKYGKKLSRYNEGKRINKEILTVGRYLFDKNSKKIYHTGLPSDGKDYNSLYYIDNLAQSDLIASATDGLIIGIFEDGKTSAKYMLIVNKFFNAKKTGTITLKSGKSIEKLNTDNGKTETVSASSNTISYSLEKGSGAVYVIK